MNTAIKTGLYILSLSAAATAGWYAAQYKSNTEEVISQDSIATVNGQGIERDWFIAQMKLRGGLKPGQFQSIEQKRALLDFLINEEIIYQQALEQGVGDDPAVSRIYKKTVIDKFISDNLEQKLIEVKVRNSEVESHFNNNQAIFNKPARRRGAMIVAEISDQDDENSLAEKRSRIDKAKQAVNDLPEDTMHFGELAKIYSDDRASMYQGGVMGWLINHPGRKYKWDQSLIDALFALEKPGDVSELIETDKGFYVVRLVAAENVKEKTFDQVKKGIKNQMIQDRRQQVKEDFMTALMAGAEVEVDQQKLASIPALSTVVDSKDKTPPALPRMGGAQ